MKQLAAFLFIVILMNSCKKEEDIDNYEIKIDASNNIPLKISADFEVFINLDSSRNIIIKNKSKNFNKVLWDFGDNSISTEINPKHTYTINGKKTIKLIVENAQKQKDSLAITLYDKLFENQNQCEFFLTDIPKISYTVYSYKFYGGDGKFYYSIGNTFNINPTQYVDSFSFDSYTTNKRYFYTYYSENKITTFKKHNTFDLKDFYSLTKDFGSSVSLYDRTFQSGSFDPVTFNDTILNIQYNNGFVEIKDTKLGHSFRGYLSSYSSSNSYVFSMPNKVATLSGYETEIISFSKTSNFIYLEHNWDTWTTIYKTNIKYSGIIQ